MDTLRLTYSSSLSNVREINSSFDTGTLRICYPGANRNKTYFSKSTLEKGIPSIYNCPVVCRYEREDGSLGGHDIEVITDYDDQVRVVNLTQPVGVIPESSNIYFESVEEDDGTVHEYLCADVILWKRQEAYKAIKENGITAQSMEINVRNGEQVDGIFVINDFEFTAFALLGDVEPCFESASLQTYSNWGQEFKAQFSEMMSEIKESFNLLTTSEVEVDHTNSQEGGRKVEDTKLENFETETEEVVEVNEETIEEVETVEDENQEEFALNSNISEEIFAAFSDLTTPTEWGPVPQYCIADYDVESKMVYVWDHTDWLLYGFAYAMEGDKVVVDFDSKKRMKYVIAEFDEGDTQESPFFSVYEQMSADAGESKEKYSELESKCHDLSAQVDAMNDEIEELRKYRSDVEAASDKAQRDELFAKFADLNDVEEFAALVADSSDYDMEALEEKCFAIRGRNTKINFSKNETKTPKLMVTHDEKPEERRALQWCCQEISWQKMKYKF